MNPNNGNDLTEEEMKEGQQFLDEYKELIAKYGERWGIVFQTNLMVGKLPPKELLPVDTPKEDEKSI